MSDYRCVHWHDRCNQMYPGPDCPYCEKTAPLAPSKEGGEPPSSAKATEDKLTAEEFAAAQRVVDEILAVFHVRGHIASDDDGVNLARCYDALRQRLAQVEAAACNLRDALTDLRGRAGD